MTLFRPCPTYLRNARLLIILVGHNVGRVCSQFGESLFAIWGEFAILGEFVRHSVFEALSKQIQEKIHHFAGWGGVKGKGHQHRE